jgi:hypothetical protein
MWTSVSEDHVTSIFRVKNQLSKKPACNKLKVEEILSSQTLTHIRTTQRYIAEDGNIHNYRCENLKTYLLDIIHCPAFFFKTQCIRHWTLYLSLGRSLLSWAQSTELVPISETGDRIQSPKRCLNKYTSRTMDNVQKITVYTVFKISCLTFLIQQGTFSYLFYVNVKVLAVCCVNVMPWKCHLMQDIPVNSYYT